MKGREGGKVLLIKELIITDIKKSGEIMKKREKWKKCR